MATVDEQIQLAESIAKQIGGSRNARNEWMKWMQIAKRKGIQGAIQYASRLANDITIRPEVQKLNKKIAQSVEQHRQVLLEKSAEEQRIILGYVGWWLRILWAESRTETQPQAHQRAGRRK